MAYTLNTDPQSLAEKLTSGLQSELERQIKAKLMPQAEVIVSEIARNMAQSLQGRVHAWRDFKADGMQVTLVIDGVKSLVPPPPGI